MKQRDEMHQSRLAELREEIAFGPGMIEPGITEQAEPDLDEVWA